MNLDRFYVSMATMAWRRVILLAGLVGAIYFYAFFNGADAMKTGIANGRREINDLKQKLKITREATANAERFEQEVLSSIEQFNKVIEYMPSKLSSSDLMTLLTEYASKSGLRLVRTEPKGPGEKTEFYETAKLGIGLEGSYSQVVMFLSLLSQADKILTFERVELAPISNTDPEMPRLSFSGVLVGYRYLSPPKDGDAAKADAPGGGANAPH